MPASYIFTLLFQLKLLFITSRKLNLRNYLNGIKIKSISRKISCWILKTRNIQFNNNKTKTHHDMIQNYLPFKSHISMCCPFKMMTKMLDKHTWNFAHLFFRNNFFNTMFNKLRLNNDSSVIVSLFICTTDALRLFIATKIFIF